jgi:hypothetical protein
MGYPRGALGVSRFNRAVPHAAHADRAPVLPSRYCFDAHGAAGCMRRLPRDQRTPGESVKTLRAFVSITRPTS